MCTLTKKSRKKSFTGYKIAVKIDGKYYSPAMGTEYKEGAVEIPKQQNKLLRKFYGSILSCPSLFSEYMVGRTSVYVKILDALGAYADLKAPIYCGVGYGNPFVYPNENPEVVLLEMTVGSELMLGEYMACEIIAGKNIIAFKEING